MYLIMRVGNDIDQIAFFGNYREPCIDSVELSKLYEVEILFVDEYIKQNEFYSLAIYINININI